MPTGQRPKSPGGADIPDLDLGAPRSSLRAAPQRTASRADLPAQRPAPQGLPSSIRPSGGPPSGPLEYFGAGTFEDDQFDSPVALSIDTGDAAPAIGGAGAFFGDAVSLSGASADVDDFEDSRTNAQSIQSMPAPAKAPARKWPTGTSPIAAELSIDTVEIALLADYGDPPANVALAVAYAARVLPRRRKLKARLAELEQVLAAAEGERDRALIAMVQERRGAILSVDEGVRLFEPVTQLEKLALERREGLAGTNAEYASRTDEFEQARSALSGTVAERQGETARLAAALEQSRLAFERADAKKKRLYIELRGLVEAHERTGGALAPAQSARMNELEGLIAAQKGDHDAASRKLAEARAAHAGAEEAERALERKTKELGRQRKSLEQQFQKQAGVRAEGVSSAETDRNRALADVARAVLAARGRVVDVEQSALDAVARADTTVAARALELEKHVRAYHSHDAAAVRNGLLIVAALVAVIAALAMTSHDGALSGFARQAPSASGRPRLPGACRAPRSPSRTA